MPSGKISFNGESGEAALQYSATGPKASGQVTLEAVKNNGVWSLTVLKLKVDGRNEEIDLLKESRADIETPASEGRTAALGARFQSFSRTSL